MMSVSQGEIREILTRYKKVVVVGLSANPARPSHEIAEYLMSNGYDVCGVNPGHDSILGRPVYHSVSEVPQPLEIVDVFRAPEAVPALVEELIPLRPRVLWLQEGITHPEAEARARSAGIMVLSDLCILSVHQRLFT